MTEKNFNYISIGGWTGQADDTAAMTRGRMFEYTPTDIERRLERLDSAAVAFLQSLPTFLCSEVDQSDDEVAMFIRYGRITGMEHVGREVRFNFDTQVDFGRVVFPDLDTAWSTFGADRLQLFRTHWAVRNGNARDVLDGLAPFRPALESRIDEVTETAPAETPVEPPPRAKQILGTADSVESFLRLLFNSPDKEGAETFFRGHEDARFELTPSLLRRWPDGGWQFMPNEDRLCQELLIGHHDEFQGDEYCFDRLVRMQHYKLPTRLLDISGNPLVALFFACHSSPAPLEADGEVIVFQVSPERVKYYDSDTVSCLANLSKLTYAQKNDLDLGLDLVAFNETGVAGKLLHYIRSEKGFFEKRLSPDHLGSILCVKAKRTNSRIKSQSGAFLLFGHEAVLPDEGQDGIAISRITITNKPEILKQLDRLNINATTVYPSIEQTAVHLKEQYRTALTPRTSASS